LNKIINVISFHSLKDKFSQVEKKQYILDVSKKWFFKKIIFLTREMWDVRKKETETKREKKTNKIGRKRRIKDVTGDIKRKGEYNEEKKEQDKK